MFLQDEILNFKPGSTTKLKGAMWHANSRGAKDTLYVREAYPALMNARHTCIQALGWSESSSKTVFSGSPGMCSPRLVIPSQSCNGHAA